MKATLITPTRLLLEFPTRKEMTLSCFRISEFKEGKPEIKGRYFTPDEFIDAYSDEKGDLDYFSYWEGFNFSKKNLLDFFIEFCHVGDAFFDSRLFSKREHRISVASIQLPEDGYIIAMVEGDEMTLKHETAHGLFFENEEYRKKATEIVNSLGEEVIEKYRTHLVGEMDYNESVLIDEIHAYLVAFDQEEHDECFPSITEDDIYSNRANIQGLFDKFNK